MWYKFALVEIKDQAQQQSIGIGGGIMSGPVKNPNIKPINQLESRHVGEILATEPKEIGNTGKAMKPLKPGDQESGFVVEEGAAVRSIKTRNLHPNLPNAVETTTEEKLDALRHESTENPNAPAGDEPQNDNKSMGSTEDGRGFETVKNLIGGENNPIGGNPAHLLGDEGLARTYMK